MKTEEIKIEILPDITCQGKIMACGCGWQGTVTSEQWCPNCQCDNQWGPVTEEK